MAGRYYNVERPTYMSSQPVRDWPLPPTLPLSQHRASARHTQVNGFYPTEQHLDRAPPMNGLPVNRRRSSSRKRQTTHSDKTPRTIDVIGDDKETTISGHIDLLQHLPLHSDMHRRLLETFRREPGDYEGQYTSDSKNKAVVKDLGHGYLSIHFYKDVTQVELSEFLLAKGWKTLAVSYDGGKTFAKWTNVIKKKAGVVQQQSELRGTAAERYY